MKKGLNIINNYLALEEAKDLMAVRNYCEEEGYVEDYYNIFLPLYKKYGWELIRDFGEIKWDRFDFDNYKVVYLNLDRLSTLVEWNERRKCFVAV